MSAPRPPLLVLASCKHKPQTFAGINCAIAQALEQVGEWWTFPILRNAFFGMRRFDDFQRHLGIATKGRVPTPRSVS